MRQINAFIANSSQIFIELWVPGVWNEVARWRGCFGAVLISDQEASMMLMIPRPLKMEHDELHAELAKATKAGGRTGEAAKAVAKVLHPHFVKEEEYALPPLGLLVPLSQGKVEKGMAAALAMTDKLEAELPQMLAEHKAIVAALGDLVDAAKAENKPEVAQFAEKLILHAQTEEQVSYPTALLVGRYLKAKLTA